MKHVHKHARLYFFLSLIITTFLLFSVGCAVNNAFSTNDPMDYSKSSSLYGDVILSFSAPNRSMNVANYEITATRSGETDVSDSTTSQTTTLTLKVGSWNIDVTGKDENDLPIYYGYTEVDVIESGINVSVGLVSMTGAGKYLFDYAHAGYITSINATASRDTFSDRTSQVDISTVETNGSIYLFDMLEGDWDIVLEARDSANTLYYSKIFTHTLEKNSVNMLSLTLDQVKVTDIDFSPAAGSYNTNQAVTLSCATPASQIYYTTDGSTPSAGSTLYTGPVSVSGDGTNVTIKAIGVKSGLSNSKVTSQSYSITYNNLPTVTFNPGAGNYNSDQSVTLQCGEPGSTILYSIDGSSPSLVYSLPVFITSGTTTIRAKATKTGWADSSQTEAAYTIDYPNCSAPVMTPAGGSYTSDQSVTITTSTSGAQIYYTTDGTSPDSGSIHYSSPVSVTPGTVTIKAIAYKSAYDPSPVTTELYQVDYQDVAAPVLSPAGGTYNQAQSITITSATPASDIYYTIDGSEPDTGSSLYSGPVNLDTNGTYTIKARAYKTGFDPSSVSSEEYTINIITTTFRVHIDVGVGNEIYIRGDWDTWTTGNLATWTAGNIWEFSTTDLSGSFEWKALLNDEVFESGANHTGSAGDTISTDLSRFRINYDTGGGTMYLQGDQSPLSWVEVDGIAGTWTTGNWWEVLIEGLPATVEYKWRNESLWQGGANRSGVRSETNESSWENPLVLAPVMMPSGGTYSSDQSVTIASATSGATIYYTTDGSTPTTGSNVYSSAISVTSGSMTIKAIAVKSGYDNSSVSTEAYNVDYPNVATPVMSPAGGTFTSDQSVTLSTATSGATILYSTDGSAPSLIYSSAIALTMGTTQIRAKAVKSGMDESSEASEAYIIDYPNVATPAISPAAGTYASPVSITMTCSTSGATIHYTTDGSTPGTGSSVYSNAINFTSNGTWTIKAVAVKSGMDNSSVATRAYTLDMTVANPTISPAGGSYTSDQSIMISCATSGATIYYTTDGSTPDTSDNIYSGSITVTSGSTTIKARAYRSGYNPSAVTSNTYTINYPNVGAPVISPSGGTYSQAQSVTIVSPTSGSTIYYTTDGTTPDTSDNVYSGPIELSSNGSYTIKARAYKAGYDPSNITTENYTINILTTTFRVHLDVGIGNDIYIRGDWDGWSTGNLATWTAGDIWVYTTTELSGSFNFKALLNDQVFESGADHSGSAGDTIDIYLTRFRINYDTGGGTMYLQGNQSPLTWVEANGIAGTWTSGNWWEVLVSGLSGSMEYKWRADSIWQGGANRGGTSSATNISSWENPIVAAPVMAPLGGTFTSNQSVTLSTTTSGSQIYYSTDGSAPSTLYTSAIAVNSSMTIKAQAVKSGYDNSSVTTEVYTIDYPDVAAPAISPVSGTYTSPLSITMSCATSGATIHYTTNGSTPTTGSPVYSGAINYTSNGSWTVKAIAVKSGMDNSSVQTRNYTLDMTVAAPAMSPAGGTYSSTRSVSISCATSGATIYYSTDGSIPNLTYSSAISVSSTMTLKARATRSGYNNSTTITQNYIIDFPNAATPVMSPAGGSYTSDQSVSISCSTSGATIYYTTDGSTPDIGDNVYSGAITITPGTTTLKAKAYRSGYDPSSTASQTYTVNYPNVADPVISPSGGTFSQAQSVTISCATSGSTIYYTTDGSTPNTGDNVYSGAIDLSSNGTYTIKAKAYRSGYDPSGVTTENFTINILTTMFRVHVDTGSDNIYIRGDWDGWSTGYAATWTAGDIWVYTTTALSGTFNFKALLNDQVFESGSDHSGTAGDTINIYLTRFRVNYDTGGGTMYLQGNQAPLSWVEGNGIAGTWTSGNWWELLLADLPGSFEYKWRAESIWQGGANRSGIAGATNTSSWENPIVDTPTISPNGGSYTTDQSVTINCGTTGATILYSTDGSTPSLTYSGAISVGQGSTTVKAKATLAGYDDSATASETYSIDYPDVATPIMNPAGGSFTSDQNVTISCATSGATIYYSTNGSDPYLIYSGAITVGEGSMIIKAEAVKSGMDDSAVRTENYTVTYPTVEAPVMSPAGGSYTSAQSVTISTATSGATIHYTTDGSTPTTGSAVYSSAIDLDSDGSYTIKALAVKSGYTGSAVTTEDYTIAITVTTTIRVHLDAGFGNEIFIRGDWNGWASGQKATWTSGNIWEYQTTDISGAFLFKALLNDEVFEYGNDHSANAGGNR
jgi:hypothetical protein